MKKEELDHILQQHRLWLGSDGEKGKRADLWGADLRGADLRVADLRCANLQGAELDTNIRNCRSFYKAKFTSNALPWLILHSRWAKFKDTVQIIGG